MYNIIEIVSNLNTEAFLVTLKRFISYRGYSSHIYSDNIINFHGSHNRLHETYKLLNLTVLKQPVNEFFLLYEILWHFITSSSPHHGGL